MTSGGKLLSRGMPRRVEDAILLLSIADQPVGGGENMRRDERVELNTIVM